MCTRRVLIELSSVTELEKKMDEIETARDRNAGKADLIFIIELDNHTPMGVYTLPPFLYIHRNPLYIGRRV